MARGKRDDLGSDFRLETLLAQQLELPTPGVQIATRRDEGGREEPDEPLSRGRGRVEVPGTEVRVLQHDPGAWRREPEVGRELLVGPPERPNLETGVHQVERAARETAVKEVV